MWNAPWIFSEGPFPPVIWIFIEWSCNPSAKILGSFILQEHQSNKLGFGGAPGMGGWWRPSHRREETGGHLLVKVLCRQKELSHLGKEEYVKKRFLKKLSCVFYGRHSPLQFSSAQSLSHVQLFVTPRTAAHQASLSTTISQSLPKLMSIESVMPSNHLILCRPLLLLPSIFPSIRVFSNESAVCIRWPKYWNFSLILSPSNEYSGLISFRMDWLDLLAVQGNLKSLLQHHSSKASILRPSAFFKVQLSHAYMTTGKTIALTRRTFVGKVMSLLFNMLSRLVVAFLPRSERLLMSWLQSPSAVILEPKKINSEFLQKPPLKFDAILQSLLFDLCLISCVKWQRHASRKPRHSGLQINKGACLGSFTALCFWQDPGVGTKLCQCCRLLVEWSVQGTLNKHLYWLILDSQKFLGCQNLPLENCKSFSMFLVGTLRLIEWYHRILCNFSRTGTFLGGELVSFLFPSSLSSLDSVAEVDLN